MSVIWTIYSLKVENALTDKHQLSGWGREILPSDLRIDPAEYRGKLLERWPQMEFADAGEYHVLRWSLYDNHWGLRSGEGLLHKDLQTVSINAPKAEFVAWHRALIPTQYRLFLMADYKDAILELLPDTSLDQIRRFM